MCSLDACCRRRKIDFAVEPSGASQRRVDRLDAVGGADDDHSLRPFQPIHQGQQLRHRAQIGHGPGAPANGSDRVDLVHKDDRRRFDARLAKEFAQVLFRLPGIRADDFGSVDVAEARVNFIGHAAREQRLAGAWRAVKDDASGRRDAQLSIDLRKQQRQLDQLAHFADLLAQAADVFVRRVYDTFGGALVFVAVAFFVVVLVVVAEGEIHAGVTGHEPLLA